MSGKAVTTVAPTEGDYATVGYLTFGRRRDKGDDR